MVHTFRAVAALAAVFYASPAYSQDNEQRPLAGDYEYPARDARLHLYNKPKFPCVPGRGQPMKDIDVPVNTCVTADFTLDNNVHVAYAGLCPGGWKSPYMAIYPSSDCTGEHAHPRWYDRGSGMGPGHCLSKAVWNAAEEPISPPENKWSIAFRCGDPESPEPLEMLKISEPALPPPPPKPKPKPRPTTASISDSACYIPGLPGLEGAPRFIFKRTEADNCLDIKPKHRLKIYRNALCANDTEAMFARFEGTGCRGAPAELREVDKSMMANNFDSTCIKMGGEEAASYAFWCTGELERKSVKGGLFPDDSDGIRIHYTNQPMQRPAGISSATALRAGGMFGVIASIIASVCAFLVVS